MINIEFTKRYSEAFNKIESNYSERSSGIGTYFIPTIILIVALQLLEVIEFVSTDFKTVLIVYLTLASVYFSISLWIKNNILYHSYRYSKYIIFLPLIIYWIVSVIIANLLIKQVNMKLSEILNISSYIVIFLGIIIVAYALGNKNSIEKGFANIHYRLSILCLNYIYTLDYPGFDEFNEKCILVEKISATCSEIKQLYTDDEVRIIKNILSDVKALIINKKKYKSINKYIDWLFKELDNQTKIV